MSCYVDMFHNFPHNKQHYTKPYGGQVLIWDYHLCFDPKIGQRKCSISCIRFKCNACTDKLDLSQNSTLCDK